MRALPVTSRQATISLCGQSPSLHAEGLKHTQPIILCAFLHTRLWLCHKKKLHTLIFVTDLELGSRRNIHTSISRQRNAQLKSDHCTSVSSMLQINHQPDATIFQFIIPTFICSSACIGHSPAHHQELSDRSSSLCFYLCIVVIAVLCSWSAWPQPRTQHDYHHDMKVKPELLLWSLSSWWWAGECPKHAKL
jgi:hypothetical protein